MSEEMKQKLTELMILLDKEHHPHTTIIVTSTNTEIVEGVACVQNDVLVD